MSNRSCLAIVLLAGAGVAAASSAHSAGFSVTPTLTSDYDFRGISLSEQDPALQISLDFSTEAGFKAFVWATNTEIGVEGVSTEIDYAIGWAGNITEKIGLDTGIVYYTYPGESSLAYPEAWIGIGGDITDSFNLSGKLWYSWDYAALDESATYIEANATYALPVWDLGLTLHAGFSDGDYWDNTVGDGYFDWSIGLAKSFDNLNLSLRYVDGSDLADTPGSDLLSTDSKVVLSLSTTLPWTD